MDDENFGSKVKVSFVEGVQEKLMTNIIVAAKNGRTNYSTKNYHLGLTFLEELDAQGIKFTEVDDKVVFDWADLVGEGV